MAGVNPDVLIVGAGPTGLVLACELARSGVSFRIVEKETEPSTRSRALVVHARTLELLQKLDLDGELVARGRRTVNAHVYVNREHAADFAIGDTGIDDTPFPFVLFVSQAETEAVLAGWLARAGATIERGVEATAVDPASGEVTLRRGDAIETVRPRWVVGCDGAHSVVRHAGEFAFEGEPYPQDFVLADVKLDTPIDALELAFDDRGVFVVLPLKDDVYRIITTLADAPKATGDPSLADVQTFADVLSPVPLRLREPIWLARFRLHHRQADHYRRGPLFLAGDAAHIHSPAGGQGMNTGMQDAANLAWKLALVARGEAPEHLLDTYEEERHPVGRDLLRTTDRLFSINTTREVWAKALRNFVIRHVAPRVLSSRLRRAFAFRFLAELKIAYTRSSIVTGGAAGPRPGARAPDAPLDSGETIFSMTRDPLHHLLVFGNDLETAEAFAKSMARFPWLRAHRVGSAVARQRYEVIGQALYLLRPDGYVGMAAPTLDASAVERYAACLELRPSEH